jgi:hypothetical protein
MTVMQALRADPIKSAIGVRVDYITGVDLCDGTRPVTR